MTTYTITSWNAEDGEVAHVFNAQTNEHIADLSVAEYENSAYASENHAENIAANAETEYQRFIFGV